MSLHEMKDDTEMHCFQGLFVEMRLVTRLKYKSSEFQFRRAYRRVSGIINIEWILNCGFHDVQSGNATARKQLREADFRLAGIIYNDKNSQIQRAILI
jgi:hypothetical protein